MKKCEELLLEDAIYTAIKNEKRWLKMKFYCTAAITTAVLEGIALIILLIRMC